MPPARIGNRQDPDAHDGHPIAVAAARSGLSQDVLRVWERRYRAVRPSRAPGGQRLYTDSDIERLRLLRMATQAGRSIGRVAGLPTDALTQLVSEDATARERIGSAGGTVSNPARTVSSALEATRQLDGRLLEEALRSTLALEGLTQFVDGVVVPFLTAIGDEWEAGRLSPSEEHLASSVLESILLDATRSLAPPKGAHGVLAATLASERHSLGAAIAGAVAAAAGWRVVYLGADLPSADIAEAARSARVHVVALSVVYVDDAQRVVGELRRLRRLLPSEVSLFVGGAGAVAVRADLARLGATVCTDLPTLRAALADYEAPA
jgi:MerR family transcriptional regulator, light-induced transcriptional regulator